MEPSDTLQVAAKVLAYTASPNRASRKSGIPVAEIRRLQTADIDFAAMVLEYRTANIMKTALALARAGPLAVRVLEDELSIPAGPKKVRKGRPPKDNKYSVTKEVPQEHDPRRIRAAKVVLELFPKMIEIADLASRISLLEQQLSQRVNPPTVDVEVLPALPESPPTE